jgi:hypothetical protein
LPTRWWQARRKSSASPSVAGDSDGGWQYQAVSQQGIQFAAGIQRGQVVETAHVAIADVDLGHGAAAGDAHHLLALGRIEIDRIFSIWVTPFLFSSFSAMTQ